MHNSITTFRSLRGNKRKKQRKKEITDDVHAHMTAVLLIPVTPGEERENKPFIRVLHCIHDD